MKRMNPRQAELFCNLLVVAYGPGMSDQSWHTGLKGKRNAYESAKDFARQGYDFVQVRDMNSDGAVLWASYPGHKDWSKLVA
jgi:hypothetical protein